jgi:hypothetical protein
MKEAIVYATGVIAKTEMAAISKGRDKKGTPQPPKSRLTGQ